MMNKIKLTLKSLLPKKKVVSLLSLEPMGVRQVGEKLPFNEMASKQLPTISHIVTKEN